MTDTTASTDTASTPTAELVTVEQRVHIGASPETVWTFWTDPERMAEWWGAADLDAVPGGGLRVVMESGPVMCGTYTELDPPHRLVFSFGWEGNAPGEPLAPGSTSVEVVLTPDGGGTLCTLRHSDMPATHASDHAKGWALYVGERLVAATEGDA